MGHSHALCPPVLGVVCNYTFLFIRICNSGDLNYFHSMGEAYQIRDQEIEQLKFFLLGTRIKQARFHEADKIKI